MILIFDIGNSDVTIGLWNGQQWAHLWRTPSKIEQPELFYGIKVRDYFLESQVHIDQVSHIVLSSVVPGLTAKIKNVISTIFNKEPLMVGPAIYSKIPLEILNPYEIGTDLVANASAAYARFHQTCIVVDFGTALTFTTVSGKGKILGVSIAPGLKTAIRSLSQNTAKLFDVPLEIPPSALGTTTITAIQSGIIGGYEGLVKNVVTKIRTELKEECPAIATGGLSSIITPLKEFFYAVEPNLTLDGLRVIFEWVNNK
ncbi:MAG: type III pantothenate kinase [Bacteroidetes bacterium]|nr:type III pantothenate kinase [Bacteroidota bacterium]